MSDETNQTYSEEARADTQVEPSTNPVPMDHAQAIRLDDLHEHLIAKGHDPSVVLQKPDESESARVVVGSVSGSESPTEPNITPRHIEVGSRSGREEPTDELIALGRNDIVVVHDDGRILPPDGTPTREITAAQLEDITTQEFTPPDRQNPTPPERPLAKGIAGANQHISARALADSDTKAYEKELTAFKQRLANATGREIVGLKHQQNFEGQVLEQAPSICGAAHCVVRADHKMLVARATPEFLDHLGKDVKVATVRDHEGNLAPKVTSLERSKNASASRGQSR